MSEIRTVTAAEPPASRPQGTGRLPTVRAAVTNNPLRRASGNTPEGRRVRDLMRAYTAALGNPTDPATQAQVIRAAELVVAAEAARAAYLAKPADQAMLDQVIRLENLSARSLAKLGLGGRRVAARQPSVLEALARP